MVSSILIRVLAGAYWTLEAEDWTVKYSEAAAEMAPMGYCDVCWFAKGMWRLTGKRAL